MPTHWTACSLRSESRAGHKALYLAFKLYAQCVRALRLLCQIHSLACIGLGDRSHAPEMLTDIIAQHGLLLGRRSDTVVKPRYTRYLIDHTRQRARTRIR